MTAFLRARNTAAQGDCARGEMLLVIGANGGVGGAAAQIGKWRGARVIGADRRPLSAEAPAARAIDDFVVLGGQTLEADLRRTTNGRGADLVFDTVGGPMFEPALKSLAHRGRLVEISSAGDRRVGFDLIDFYHNESRLFGVNTQARDAIASAKILEALKPFFERGAFQPPAIDQVIALSDGREAYEEVAGGKLRGRIVLAP